MVIPMKPHFGTWRTLAVCKARDVLKLPTGLLAMEHAALACHLCTAYRLLESCRSLQVRPSHRHCGCMHDWTLAPTHLTCVQLGRLGDVCCCAKRLDDRHVSRLMPTTTNLMDARAHNASLQSSCTM